MATYVSCVGSPYEMGYAHGELMKDKATQFMNDVWTYFEQQVVKINMP